MIVQKGEVREIGIEVESGTKNNFIIEAADYEIIKPDLTLGEKGVADIDGPRITLMFSALEIGQYSVIITYRIGPEILKAKILIRVVL